MVEELPVPTRAFVLGLADAAGALEADALYRAAEAAGFSATKLRLALRRLVEAGLAEVDGRGRAASVQLTARGLAEREPDLWWTAAAYRGDAGLDPWDGVWHFAAFEIPESERRARDELRRRLVELIGAPMGGGLYVSPLPWEPWLVRVASEHGVTDRLWFMESSVLTTAGRASPTEVAAGLWPLDRLHGDYSRFVERWGDTSVTAVEDPSLAVRLAFEISGEFEAAIRDDPLLPPELLPSDFAGAEARAIYLRVLRQLSNHRLVADANLFGTYLRHVETALAMTADDFWLATFQATS